MEQIFVIRATPDKDAYHTYAKVHMDARIGGPLTRAMTLLLGLLIVAGGAAAIWYAGFRLLYALSMLVGLLAIFARPIGIFRMTQRLITHAADLGMTIDYLFGADSFTAESPDGTIYAAYAEVCRVVETDRYFFIYTGEQMAHIIPKVGFTKGDPLAFASFIMEKTKVHCVGRAY